MALHGVAVAEMKGGKTVLVIGAGMIGLLLLQAARAAGASRVMICDLDATRLALAEKLGADRTFLASGDALIEEILRETGGRGVDVVLEAVGREETIAAAIDCVRKGGTISLVGNISPQIGIPLQKVVSRQIRLQGSCASAGEYEQAIDLIARGAVKVDSLITAVAPLGDGPAWFERLHAREPNLMKIVLDPRMTSSSEQWRSLAMTPGLFDLTGQVALVTGASRGLGQYFARALAKAGADLILTSRRKDDLLPFRCGD